MPPSLTEDTVLMQHYSTEEIAQLEAIVSFFEGYALQDCQGSDSISLCYQQYLNRLWPTDSLIIGVPFKEQNIFYLADLDKGLFHSIWTYSPSRAHLGGDQWQYYNQIDYNRSGRYWKFLKDVAEVEPYFYKYVEPMEAAGDFPPSTYTGFAYNPSGLDFNNERHRLILAVHFLMVNDILVTTPNCR